MARSLDGFEPVVRMKKMINRPVFLLRLQPLKGVDPVRALRALLKLALRKHGMRCLAAEQAQTTTDN
jgi:hypothetical protein